MISSSFLFTLTLTNRRWRTSGGSASPIIEQVYYIRQHFCNICCFHSSNLIFISYLTRARRHSPWFPWYYTLQKLAMLKIQRSAWPALSEQTAELWPVSQWTSSPFQPFHIPIFWYSSPRPTEEEIHPRLCSLFGQLCCGHHYRRTFWRMYTSLFLDLGIAVTSASVTLGRCCCEGWSNWGLQRWVNQLGGMRDHQMGMWKVGLFMKQS